MLAVKNIISILASWRLEGGKSCLHVLRFMDCLGSRGEGRPHGLSGETGDLIYTRFCRNCFSVLNYVETFSSPTDTPISIKTFHVNCLPWIRQGYHSIFFLQ